MKKTFFVVILVVILSGCQLFKPQTTEQSAVVSAQSGVAGIVAHTQSAECAVVAAKPHTNAQGKVSLETATAEHAAVIGETDKVSAALDKALTEVAVLNQDRAQWKTRAEADEATWGFIIGRWIRRVWWASVIILVVAVIIQQFAPVSGAAYVIHFIIKFFVNLIGAQVALIGGLIGKHVVKPALEKRRQTKADATGTGLL